MASCYGNLGVVEEKRGDAPAARERWTAALELYRKIGIQDKVELIERWLNELPPE